MFDMESVGRELGGKQQIIEDGYVGVPGRAPQPKTRTSRSYLRPSSSMVTDEINFTIISVLDHVNVLVAVSDSGLLLKPELAR